MRQKTTAALVLAGMLLGPAAHAFPEPRPVPMTADGVFAFQQSMPEDAVIERGLSRAMSEGCPNGCYVPSVAASEAITGYLDGLFDYHGYDYGDTVYDYAHAMVGPSRIEDRELGMATQYTRLGEFMDVAIDMLQAGEGARLKAAGILTPQQTHDLRELLEPGYMEPVE